MRCGGEPRARSRPGSEPLLKETSTLTKLLWALGAACVLGGVLLYAGLGESEEPANIERGVVVQAEDAPPTATEATPAEERAARAAAARAENARNEEARQAAELQSARARVPVVMYSTTWCGVCASARTYLDARRVRFTEYDVESNEAARAEHARLNPQRSVPTFDIGGEVLTGFSETAFEAALDAAAARRTP